MQRLFGNLGVSEMALRVSGEMVQKVVERTVGGRRVNAFIVPVVVGKSRKGFIPTEKDYVHVPGDERVTIQSRSTGEMPGAEPRRVSNTREEPAAPVGVVDLETCDLLKDFNLVVKERLVRVKWMVDRNLHGKAVILSECRNAGEAEKEAKAWCRKLIKWARRVGVPAGKVGVRRDKKHRVLAILLN